MHRLLLLFALAACTHPHDVIAHYPGDGPSGSVDIVMNHATGALTVAVNDKVIVEKKYSAKAHIDGVPIGEAVIQIATGGACEAGKSETRTLDVQPGMTSTIVLPGPEPNTACAVWAGLNQVTLGLEVVGFAILALATPHAMSHVKN
jgi:hypothetical protein